MSVSLVVAIHGPSCHMHTCIHQAFGKQSKEKKSDPKSRKPNACLVLSHLFRTLE